jgi:hypothetical protein
MKGFVVGLLLLAASPGALGGEEGARCPAEVGEVVSLEQLPAVPGTQLGVGFDVVPPGEGGEPSSPWCNNQACDTRWDGTNLIETCRSSTGWHCFLYGGTCWSERCYIIRQ